MHEQAIAAVAEVEWDGFVHVRCLGALRVGDEEVDLLSRFVEAGERLTAAEDFLAGEEAEDGVDGA